VLLLLQGKAGRERPANNVMSGVTKKNVKSKENE